MLSDLINIVVVMKKILLVFSLLAVFSVPSYAATASPSSGIQAVQERVQARKETLQERIEQHRLEIQNRVEERKERLASRASEVRRRLTERRREIIRRHFRRMMLRFKAAIARLERIASRIESRLTKMEDGGIDVSSLKVDLIAGREDLAVAEGLLEDLEDKVEEALESEDPKAEFEVIKDTVVEARDLLKSVHQQLVAIISQMKALNTSGSEATQSAAP